MSRRIVTPSDGMVVLDPYGRRLPKEGAWVDGNDSYWDRRCAEGSVTFSETEPEATKAPRKSRKPKETEE